MGKPPPFIEKHALWSDEERVRAEDVRRRVERDGIKLVRLAWADPHG
jgi:glutamine synthetase